MRRHVARHAPEEACGLLAGIGSHVERVIGVPNSLHSPVRFRMEPRAQWRAFQRIEAEGLDLVGIYHSHPSGPDHPSPTDIAESMYPVVSIIWYPADGAWTARGFSIESGKWNEIALEIKPAG
jgi:proteasome lid subunit RPN8/RPN11